MNVRVLELYTPQAIRAELERVGADSSVSPARVNEQLARAQFHIVKFSRASLPLARLLYQELTIEGGQVVTAPRLEHVGEGETDVLLCATAYQFNHLLVRLRWQPSDDASSRTRPSWGILRDDASELQLLADDIERALDAFVSTPPSLELGITCFDWSRTCVMGILNVTPDSFSGDALVDQTATEAETAARALQRAREHIANGADILDIGGESTRPNATPVPLETEMERVIPILRILGNEISTPLSIDTSKAKIADAALEAGAHLINDVTGLRGDPEMKRVIASHNAPVVIMHNWLQFERPTRLTDLLGVMLDELRAQIDTALDAGIAEKNILIDPGLGFGKTANENLEILNRLGEFRVLGFPILIGPSRKGFIGKTLDVPSDQRLEGTAAAISIGIARGANMIRVHDVKEMTRVARMTDAINSSTT